MASGENGSRLVAWLPGLAAGASMLISIYGWVSTLGAMSADIATIKASISAISSRLDKVEESQQRREISDAELKAAICQQFAKTETQIGQIEATFNETRVDDLRTRGVIWPKLFHEPYPPQFYEIKIPHEIQPC